MANRTSRIILAKGIKIDRAYKNILSYSESDMLTLLRSNSHFVNELSNCSFIRKTSTIMVDITYEQAIQSNYIAFQNPDYSNKWFFAWIDEIKYIGERNIEISYTIDDWSTWSGNLVKKACWVEREHVSDDTLGAHTVDEGLELGDFVVNAHLRDSYNRGNQRIVVASNIEPSDGQKVYAGVYQGVASGFRYFSYPKTDAGLADVVSHILLCENRQGDINQLFMAPEWLAGNTISMLNSPSPETHDLGVSRITSLNGYTPHNNKLLTHPFCYILLSNGQGQDAILKQELWALDNNNEMISRMEGCLTAGCSIRLTPINYNGDDHSAMYGITLGKFPQISWSTDPYVNWLTENGINTVVNIATGLGRVAGGDITGGVQAFNSAREMELASQVPPQVKGNTNAGDVMYATNENCFHVYRMTIKQEIARIIDNYFTRYGYKVNTLKIPEFNSRPYWNYIKITEGENIGYGIIPSKAMDTINNIFRTGTSVWHSHDNLGNFSLANW